MALDCQRLEIVTAHGRIEVSARGQLLLIFEQDLFVSLLGNNEPLYVVVAHRI